MYKSRFQINLAGEFGPYWKKEANATIEKVRKELDAGEITIDGNGVAHNCIGRVLVEDQLEPLALVTDKVDVEATRAARQEETERFLSEYRKKPHPFSAEDLAELRAEVKPGTVIVNVLSGERYVV